MTLGETPGNFRKHLCRETLKNKCCFSKIDFDPPVPLPRPPWGVLPCPPMFTDKNANMLGSTKQNLDEEVIVQYKFSYPLECAYL